MDRNTVQSDALLMTTAVIWGVAFVAQRVGMEYVGPFTFNGVRFALGCLVLLPFLRGNTRHKGARTGRALTLRTAVLGGGLAGVMLFSGASLQQAGLVSTTAGNAGFITGLYVVIVPILGLACRQRTHAGTWIGALLAAGGLYLLSVTEGLTMAYGDLLVLAGAFFWAGHVLVIGWLSPRIDSFRLAFLQYAVCAGLSLVAACGLEVIALPALKAAWLPIFYGGVFSVGVAYTLQVVAQRRAHPAHAAIILSLEAVFAALGGWLLLEETFSLREVIGCALMLAGMLFSQLWSRRNEW